MRNFSRRSTLVLLAVGCIGFAAQAKADTAQNVVHDHNDQDNGKHFLLGTWDCRGHIVLPEDRNNPERVRNTVGRLKVYKKGDIFVERFHNRASTGREFRHYGWVRYDEKSDSLRRRGVNNFGGWSFAVSPGWDGDQMVWDGELRAFGHRTIGVQEIFTRGKGDSLVWELRTTDLDGHWKWKVMYKGWCEKPEANENHGGDDNGSDDNGSDDNGDDNGETSDDGGTDASTSSDDNQMMW